MNDIGLRGPFFEEFQLRYPQIVSLSTIQFIDTETEGSLGPADGDTSTKISRTFVSPPNDLWYNRSSPRLAKQSVRANSIVKQYISDIRTTESSTVIGGSHSSES